MAFAQFCPFHRKNDDHGQADQRKQDRAHNHQRIDAVLLADSNQNRRQKIDGDKK